MRRRLAAYFERKNCLAPDDLAEDTLNRIARRLDEEPALAAENAGRYCYVVARYVFLESLRPTRPREIDIEALTASGRSSSSLAAPAAPDAAERQRLLDCLDHCLEKLQQHDRDLILEYYRDDQKRRIERRRTLARRLGVTANAVSIRACRIRGALETCVRSCHLGA